MRLLDFYQGRLSYREMWVLVSHLPMQSWTQTRLRDTAPESELVNRDDTPRSFGPWGLENYQLADLIDAVNLNTFAVARTAGNDKFQGFPRTERPGVTKARGLGRRGAEYLLNLRSRRGADG